MKVVRELENPRRNLSTVSKSLLVFWGRESCRFILCNSKGSKIWWMEVIGKIWVQHKEDAFFLSFFIMKNYNKSFNSWHQPLEVLYNVLPTVSKTEHNVPVPHHLDTSTGRAFRRNFVMSQNAFLQKGRRLSLARGMRTVAPTQRQWRHLIKVGARCPDQEPDDQGHWHSTVLELQGLILEHLQKYFWNLDEGQDERTMVRSRDHNQLRCTCSQSYN